MIDLDPAMTLTLTLRRPSLKTVSMRVAARSGETIVDESGCV